MGFVASYIRGLLLVKVSLQQIKVILFIRLLLMHIVLMAKAGVILISIPQHVKPLYPVTHMYLASSHLNKMVMVDKTGLCWVLVSEEGAALCGDL